MAEYVVVGAGIMGLSTARELRERGHDVALVDAFGPGNPRATSSDENRVIRCGYGGADLYSKWAKRSLAMWASWQLRWDEQVLYACGVLWLVMSDEAYGMSIVADLTRNRVPFDVLDARALKRRYPQIDPRGVKWSILETGSGTLLARKSCLAIAREFELSGGRVVRAEVRPGGAVGRRLKNVVSGSSTISGRAFVFACGPWLPRLFPALLKRKIAVTRKDVFYFGTPPGDERFDVSRLPVWLELGTKCYGIPSVDGRGFKATADLPGRAVDPSTMSRTPSAAILKVTRACLKRRFPGMAAAPVVESRVCQYEATKDDQMIFDRHPDFENVWIVGGGSGHCFKHGPVIGELVADVVAGPPSAVDLIPEPLRLSHVPAGRSF